MHIQFRALRAPLQAACGVLAFAITTAPTRAEEAPQADTSFSVGEIIVTARGMAGNSANVVTSIDRLGGDVAQNANVNYAWELLGRLPGVMLTNFNQGTTSGKFSFRGFNGEGEINAVKLLIDGIPSNSNDGNMPFIDMLFPLDIAGVEVVRGTSDPRYGLHAIAGSANMQTRIGGTYLDAKASIGSYATYEGQVSAGLERGGFSQNYLAAYRQSDGYRAHGDLDRLSLAGKWFYSFSPDVRLGAIARYYRGTAQEPGYLTFADARADPRMTNAYNASDGDRRTMQQYSLHFDASLDERLDWTAKAYVNRLRDDRYVKFSATTSQQRRVTNEDQWGVLTALHYHASLAGRPLMLELGGDYQDQDNISRRYLTAERVPTSQTRDQAFRLRVGGVYAQAILEVTPWLRLTPAYRIDWVGGHFDDLLTSIDAPVNDYGAIRQPKMSISLTPLQGLTLYGNWGRSFQIGVGSGAYLIPPRQTDLAPSINTGWEGGIRYALGQMLEARVALWQQKATGEIKRKLNDPLGDSENLGVTRRRGADVQLSAKPVAGLSFWGAVSHQKGVILTPDPATPQYKGNDIDHVPHWLFSGGADFTAIPRLRLSFWGGGQSSYYLASDNAQGRWGDYATLNVEAAWQATSHVELSLTARNITDERYEYVWWDGAQTMHSPADGANVTAAVRMRF